MKDSFEIALAGFARVDGDIAAEHGGFGHRADMRFFDPDIAEFGGDTQVVVDVPDRIDGQLGGLTLVQSGCVSAQSLGYNGELGGSGE